MLGEDASAPVGDVMTFSQEKMPARDTGASRNSGVNLYIKNLAARSGWRIASFRLMEVPQGAIQGGIRHARQRIQGGLAVR